MRKKLVVGNWKMHGSLVENQKLLRDVQTGLAGAKSAECAVCVPFPYLAQAQVLLNGTAIAWGAQNVGQHVKGAYTGEVSATMLKDFSCSYVIVGHSERRAMFGDDDLTVTAKFRAALAAGLTPILCVGETLDERHSGLTEQVVARQLDCVLDAAGVAAFSNAVVAYEPVWAIGTGKTAAPQEAQAVHEFIRKRIAARDKTVAQNLSILYGGSVKAANAAQLLSLPDIDGGLIGGASLIAEEFVAICRAA